MGSGIIGGHQIDTKETRGHVRALFLVALVVAATAGEVARGQLLGCHAGRRLSRSIRRAVPAPETTTRRENLSENRSGAAKAEPNALVGRSSRIGFKQIHLENPGPPVTLEDIRKFEKEIGGQLPDDYRRFLLAHNGGLCEPLLGLPWAGGIDRVGAFNSLLPAAEEAGLRESLRRLREVNPAKVDGFLPVATTFSDGYICLACRGDKVGAAFFTAFKYKIAYIDDLVPIDVTMVPLTDSFTELLDYLVEIPDPPCRIEDLGKSGTPEDLAQYLAAGNSIDALGKNRLTIVCEAIKFGNSAMLKACIERGASLRRSLEYAVGNRHIHFVEMLVKAGADVNERNDSGMRPLDYVAGTSLPGEEGKQNREMRALLIKLGAVK